VLQTDRILSMPDLWDGGPLCEFFDAFPDVCITQNVPGSILRSCSRHRGSRFPLERTLGAVDCTQHQVFLNAEQNLSEVDSSRKTALTICIKDSASHVAEATLGCFRDTLHNVQELEKSSQTGTRVRIRHGCHDLSGHACESVEHML